MVRRSKDKPEPDIEQRLQESIFDVSALSALQEERLVFITRFWAQRGCQDSLRITSLLKEGVSACSALLGATPLSRVSGGLRSMLFCKESAIGTISTSGSSGVPLSYHISQVWRSAHDSAWRLAYRHMTGGWLSGYLDPSVNWAMMRPPGGTLDELDNVINCVPHRTGVSYSREPESFKPQVIHGSVTTILEALEDPRVRGWSPRIVVLAYEGSADWQRALISHNWPQVPIHEEYGANDGGSSAFTCEHGSLHFWSNRSLPCQHLDVLRVIDLWNTAQAFVAYECGDEVQWIPCNCRCGSVLPVMRIRGRKSGKITLNNGAVISQLCPFDSQEMINLRAIRVLVKHGDSATVVIVESMQDGCDRVSIAARLHEIGFEQVSFVVKKSITELRNHWGKFQTVTDLRTETASEAVSTGSS